VIREQRGYVAEISNGRYMKASGVIYPHLLNVLKKIHGSTLEDLWSMPFNIDTVYAADGGTPHERYVKILIIFR
jgi:hypothetical protein